MATLSVCDKCGTNQHDPTVQQVQIKFADSVAYSEDIDIDLCERHRLELENWLDTVDAQSQG